MPHLSTACHGRPSQGKTNSQGQPEYDLRGVQRLRLGVLAPSCGGLLLFGASLLGLPLSTAHLAQFEALNRELGRLCSKPPPQAMTVCRLHARLLNGL